jgi:AAA+ superfamily predicted ATPase
MITNPQTNNNLTNLNQYALAVCQNLEQYLASVKNQTPPESFASLYQLPKHPALATICTVFNLSPFDLYILLLCVAIELEPYTRILCAEINGNERLAYPTPYLACKTFPDATCSAFNPSSPLIKWKLIELKIDRVFTQSSMNIDTSILLYLLGNPYEAPELQSIIKPVNLDKDPQILPLSHQRIVEQIIEIRNRSTEFATKNTVIQLCGEDGGAKTDIAAVAASIAGSIINEISLPWLAATLNSPTSELNLETFIKLSTRFAILTDSFFLIDCNDMSLAEPTEIKLLSQLLKQLLNPIIILSATPLNLTDRRIVTLDVPKLTPDEQATIWQVNLGETATQLGEYINSLTNQFNLPAAAIKSACLHSLASLQQSIKANTDFDLKTALWDNCRIYARPHLDSLATRIETQRTWDDLVLPFDKKQALKEIVWHARQKYTVYGEWGFGKETRGLGINALFSGTSGTGKTTAAEIIAKELRLDLYRIDLSAVVSKYIGETEKNLAQIFAAAESSSVVLLFDEADSLFGKRSEVKDSRDRYANLEVSYLLQRMEAYQGLSILTTNFRDAIDSAFERRLRFVVEFPFPDTAQRFEMWQRVFPEKTPIAGLDFAKLANLAVTGANIRNIALNGAFLAAQAGEAVQMKHLLEAAFKECKKEGRATIGTQNWVREDQVRSRQR